MKQKCKHDCGWYIEDAQIMAGDDYFTLMPLPNKSNRADKALAVCNCGCGATRNGADTMTQGRTLKDDEKEGRFRLNDGNVKNRTMARLDSMIGAASGKRLTYSDLIH